MLVGTVLTRAATILARNGRRLQRRWATNFERYLPDPKPRHRILERWT
jgi:hypothetical protein